VSRFLRHISTIRLYPFMMYALEKKLKIQTIHKICTSQKKQKNANTAKQNYPGTVA